MFCGVFPIPLCLPLPQNLVQALGDIAAALPDLLEDIQGQLLDLLSLILSGKPFSPLTKGKAVQGLVHSLSMSELTAAEQTKLALNTIGLMDFGRVGDIIYSELLLSHQILLLHCPKSLLRC